MRSVHLHFYWKRRNSLTAYEDDGILPTTAQAEFAINGKHTDISSIKPAVYRHCFFGKVITFVITLHHRAALHLHNAFLAPAKHITVVANNAHLHTANWSAYRSQHRACNRTHRDRKSTRLNSSHQIISY